MYNIHFYTYQIHQLKVFLFRSQNNNINWCNDTCYNYKEHKNCLTSNKGSDRAYVHE